MKMKKKMTIIYAIMLLFCITLLNTSCASLYGDVETNVEVLSSDIRDEIVGTYVGEAGCVLVLGEDGSTLYYYYKNGVCGEGFWRYENSIVTFSTRYSFEYAVASAEVSNDSDVLIFRGDRWRTEEYRKVSDRCMEFSQEKYMELIVEHYPNYMEYDASKYVIEEDLSSKEAMEVYPIKIVAGGNSCEILFSDGTLNTPFIHSNDIVDFDFGNKDVIALKSDGTVEVYERYGDGKGFEDWKNVVQVSFGDGVGTSSMCALKSDGTVYVEQNNSSYNECVSEWRNIVCVSSSSSRIIYAVTSDGDLLQSSRDPQTGKSKTIIKEGNYVWVESNGALLLKKTDGSYECSSFPIVSTWTNIKEIHCGPYQVIALTKDGRILFDSTGDYEYDFSEWDGVVSVDSGDDFVCGVKKDGTYLGTGRYKWNSANW